MHCLLSDIMEARRVMGSTGASEQCVVSSWGLGRGMRWCAKHTATPTRFAAKAGALSSSRLITHNMMLALAVLIGIGHHIFVLGHLEG
jgi:hypothetical protein